MKTLTCSSIAFFLLVVPAFGVTFRFAQDQLMDFDWIADASNDPNAAFELATTDNVEYGATHDLPLNSVGFVASDVGGGSLDYIGIGLPGIDLSDFVLFETTLSNDDDDDWQYKLFAGDQVSSDWTPLASGENATLTLDISSVGSDSNIGFMIGSTREQWMHTSIPEPSTATLLAIGALGIALAWWRRKRAA